ncbi:hypothetical protein CR165_10745 [Pseudoroseomonas aestuarii]|uniref:Integrase n=1 Tax=Teichococcus aestuarii TaxID=568898 RepID=A0A2U1V560_9PROT|nr:hypothetical protein CR165_10745 [Pseudoroseomonas aestuarii]
MAVEFLVSNGMGSPSKLMAVLRAVERAFRDLGKSPDLVDLGPEVLDQATAILRESVSDLWTFGRMLERLVHEIVNPGRLSTTHLLWRSPFPYEGVDRSDRVSTEAGVVEGSEKLPHLKCILDLASVFHGATVPADVVTTAWFALAVFSPTRVTEILTLPLDCETEMDGVYGLAWRPLKGGDPMTKFATNAEWAEVARTAILRLRELGATARQAAAWYAEHPGRLYLPEGFEHLRGEPLTRWEVARIIGKESRIEKGSALDKAMRPTGKTTTDLARSGGSIRTPLYDFVSIQDYILKSLPPDFPLADKRSGLTAADALFCLPRHVMRTDGDMLLHVPDLISASQVHHDLGGKPGGTTVFYRHQLLDPRNGQPWKLTSHQPRHLLNTLAQSKHLSETLIAFWSGRKRVDQNAWYNHIPHAAFIEAYVTMGENAPRGVGVVGPLADKVEERARREMVTHDTALRLEVGSIIATRYGLCRHNYALTPCPKDKNCIGCGENTFVKGDAGQIAEARKQLDISFNAVQNCRNAMENGEPGVERWLSKHAEAVVRWGMALALLTDSEMADGTLITLPPPPVSQTRAGLTLAIREQASGHEEDDFVFEELLAVGGNF